MGLVGVLAKAITDKELEMAASGGIPPRLGGGMVGSHGVERGVEGREGYGSIEPSRAYHRAMSGDWASLSLTHLKDSLVLVKTQTNWRNYLH